MKKQPIWILVVLTVVFGAFCLGFFLGRNRNTAPVQAEVLSTVPRVTVSGSPEDIGPALTPVEFPIDLNSATRRELESLPGVGEVLAERILAYRAKHGGFSVPEELMQVEGIGEGKLEELLEYVTTGG